MNYSDKVVLVTGANRGIGYEICKQLHDYGFIVYQGMRSLKNKDEELLKKYPNIIPIEIDVTKLDTIENAKNSIVEKHSKLFALINNAGTNYDCHKDLMTTTDELLLETIHINAIGAYNTIKAFYDVFEDGARIVNVSSDVATTFIESHWAPAYALSKVVMNQFSRSFYNYFKNHNKRIYINTACPGYNETDILHTYKGEERPGGRNKWHNLETPGEHPSVGAKRIIYSLYLDQEIPPSDTFRRGELHDLNLNHFGIPLQVNNVVETNNTWVKIGNKVDKLIPKGSARRDLAKSTYHFAKAIYHLVKKIYKKIK